MDKFTLSLNSSIHCPDQCIRVSVPHHNLSWLGGGGSISLTVPSQHFCKLLQSLSKIPLLPIAPVMDLPVLSSQWHTYVWTPKTKPSFVASTRKTPAASFDGNYHLHQKTHTETSFHGSNSPINVFPYIHMMQWHVQQNDQCSRSKHLEGRD